MANEPSRGLLERVAAGDASAVREVIAAYGDLVWSLARRFTETEADAEEAAQDVFVLLWRKAGQYDRALGQEATFVSVLARRTLIDRWRRSGRRPRAEDVERLGASSDASARAETDELARRATRAFGELEEDVRSALRLSIEFGCTHEAIADLTGTPLGTVKARIRRGLRHVRAAVEGRASGATTR